MSHFDDEIKSVLDTTHQMGLRMPSPYTPDQLRMAIVGMNLRALVHTLLTADSEDAIKIDFKQVALGILGTVDFLEADLPSLDEQAPTNSAPEELPND